MASGTGEPSEGAAPRATPAPMPAEPASVVHMPVDVRSLSMGLLALLAIVFALHWARAFFIPLLVGVMLSYALSPVAERLVRWHLPRVLAAAVLVTGLIGGIGTMAWSLADDANALLDSLPEVARKLRQSVHSQRYSIGPIEKMQRAATQIEHAARETGAAPAPDPGVTRVQIETPRFNVKGHLWTGTLGLVALIGQAAIVSFLAFFLLASGDTFRRKLVKIAGPTFARRKLTVQTLDEITGQIERYLLVQVFTSALVAVATWVAFRWIGVDHAAVWGIVAGVLNLIPYIGAIVVTGGAAVVGFAQFGTLGMALTIGGASLVIQCLEGYLLTPWLTGRASRMNPVAIFVGVLAFGWLWGAWGLILGVPILLAVKAVCDRVDELKPIGELLGE